MKPIPTKFFFTPSAYERYSSGYKNEVFAKVISEITEGKILKGAGYTCPLDEENKTWLYAGRCRIPDDNGEEVVVIADDLSMMLPGREETVSKLIPLGVV